MTGEAPKVRSDKRKSTEEREEREENEEREERVIPTIDTGINAQNYLHILAEMLKI